ncbi:MAG TPA: Gfo/Idh/MocA family oxidoreductase [Acidimicrobiales bacterium]|nr:Gfo/Idh/MocA family oxidoreductase [Acidimicrobiales bacterium]
MTKVAVAGLGYWGPLLVRNLASIPTCSEIVVFDLDDRRTKAVAAGFRGATGAASFEEILDDDEVAAVVVATPVASHVDLAERAIGAGKHVLVEKPLATSRADADHLIALATEAGVLLMAGHTFLYSPAVRLVSERIRSGEIGEPVYVHSSRVNLGIHRSDSSVLWDLGPHDLSILFEWLGESPARVSASGLSSIPGREPDVAFVYLEYRSGVIANLHLSWLAPTKLRRTMLVGTRKMIVYEDTNAEEPVKIYDKGVDLPDPESFGEHQIQYRTGDVVSPRVEAWEPLRKELEHFLERVGNGETPSEPEATAAAVVGVLEAAEESLRSGGAAVELEP